MEAQRRVQRVALDDVLQLHRRVSVDQESAWTVNSGRGGELQVHRRTTAGPWWRACVWHTTVMHMYTPGRQQGTYALLTKELNFCWRQRLGYM